MFARSLDEMIKFAAGITMVGVSSIVISRWAIHKSITESDPYKKAMSLLEENDNVKDVLGSPIKAKRVDFANPEHYNSEGNTMWVTVPLKGSKRKGYLRYFVTVDDPVTKSHHVSKLEFEVEGSDIKITLMDEANKTELSVPKDTSKVI